MHHSLSCVPGQPVTIVQQVLNSDGYRADGYMGAPVISRIIYPDFSLAPGNPLAMTQFDTGLYTISFILPTGAAAVGVYIIDIYWYHPTTQMLQQEIQLINVTAPYGLYSVNTTA
jgi:hypothetical protein